MSRPSARGRPHCSSSTSAGSVTISYQGISGATSPIYHLPQEPFIHNTDTGNSYRKKGAGINDLPQHHNYYNIHQQQKLCQKQCCHNKDSIADTHSYQYFNERDERRSYGHVDNNTLSEDSSCYNYNPQDKRFVVNHLYSEYESDFPIAHKKSYNDFKYQSGKSSRVVERLDTVYPEAPLTRPVPEEFRPELLPRRCVDTVDRANSVDSSAVGSVIVDGCGGHCVAFENVCSYVLQIFFVMGVLVGVSLCIAGLVLRRTKSRDLQVLMYIGAMSAMVCTLLLVVQCRVRRALRKRKRTVRMNRSATIPLGDIRPSQQPLIHPRSEDRAVIMPVNVQPRQCEVIREEQGVPWWRRTDHSINRI